MGKQRHIVYVPGLGDQKFINKISTKLITVVWKFYGFRGHIVAPHWQEGTSFTPKLEKILAKIDDLNKQGHEVYLVGVSAGGSAVLNAYCQRREIVKGVANLAGRLKRGENTNPSLKLVARNSSSFRESVLLLEKINESTLSYEDRRKIITLRPLADNVVPVSTVSLEGCLNIQISIVGHSLACILFPTVFAKKIFTFFNKQ